MMFREILSFEIAYQLRRGSTWIFFSVILALLYLVLSEMVEYALNVEEVLINSPISVAEIATFASKFSLLMIPALVADGAMRDTQKRMDQLIYCTRISKLTYMGGRVCGTLVVTTALMLLALLLAILAANILMGADPVVLGSFHPSALVRAVLFLIVPNATIATIFLYGITWLARHAMAAYAGAMIIFILSMFNIEGLSMQWPIVKLLDPFAGTIIDAFSMTLILKERNAAHVPVDFYLLLNRAVWIGIALAMVYLAGIKFKFDHSLARSRSKKKIDDSNIVQMPIRIVSPVRSFTFSTKLFQAVSTAFRFYREIVFSAAGSFIVAIAVYAFVLIPNLSGGPMGVSILPTTDRIISYIDHSALQIFFALLISLYAGQLIWRERDARMGDIADAAPISNGWMFVAKYLSLLLLVVTIQIALFLSGLVIQLKNGYHDFQFSLYLRDLFGLQLISLLMFAAVAMVLHVLINQKYVGHLAVILFYFYTMLGSRFGLEHKLFVFGSDSGLPPSVFYHLSAYLFPWVIFKSYWIGWTMLLCSIALLFWVRGHENSARARIRKASFTVASKLQVSIALVLILAAGGVIYYHTNVLNKYRTASDRAMMQVSYEKKYGRYRRVVQPQLTATKLNVDFFPEKRSADVSGLYTIKNVSGTKIDSIHVVLSDEVITNNITFSTKSKLLIADSVLNYYLYLLDQPLRPGDSIQMKFHLNYTGTGFSNTGISTAVMNDGTYFRRQNWLPSIGYRTDRELGDNAARNKFGLSQHVARDLHDSVAAMDRSGRDRINFELIASTTKDQTVVAPGLLKKSWTKNGRSFFQYITDTPIRNIYHVYSAKYAIREAKWNDVSLKIYHRDDDTMNLKTMEEATKASLRYYTSNFSPYPSKELKWVQYADPGTGGVSHPGTIGYSTNFARLNANNPRGFDLPFAVTAHEVAHQWWGHQFLPADVEGALFLSEGLAWYSALCVVAKVKGEDHLAQLLEAMRADYFGPRARADVPLLKTVDPAKAYRKGPFAMYALREYIGEPQVNRALRNLLSKFSPGKLPFPTALDFYNELRLVTPDSLAYLLNDLFAVNTIWDLRTKSINIEKAGNHQWTVKLRYTAKKEIVDAEGNVTPIPMHEAVEIGLYRLTPGGIRESIYLQKHIVDDGENTIEIKVSEQPQEGGIDPRNLLMDMDPYNNVKKVKVLKQ